jgi:hypothetical protein
MIATIIFWVIMIAVLTVVAPRVHEAAYNNMMGYKRINGKLVQVAYPDHYTFPMIFFSYYMLGSIIVACVFFALVAMLDFTGLSQKFAIQTIFHFR